MTENSSDLSYLKEDVKELSTAIKDLTKEIRRDYLTEKHYNLQKTAQDKRLDRLEKIIGWAGYLVVGGFITALIDLVTGGGGVIK